MGNISLTTKEAQIIRLIAEGKTTPNIAAALGLAALVLSCGGNSGKLVPDFAIELSELTVDPRSESKPLIPADKVQASLQNVYSAVKKAADEGKVYKAKGQAFKYLIEKAGGL